MKADCRKLVSTANVRADRADAGGVTIRVWGRNSAGAEAIVTVHLEWWLWPILVKAVAKQWLQERLKRLSCIGDVDSAFPPEK